MATALSFVLFTGLVAVVAWWRTHNDDQDTSTGYFLAGRSLPWFVIGGSLLLTNLSTEQLVGLNGGAYQHGMIVMAWEVWSALAIVAMAVIFLPRYLKSGITTIPEYLELRYGATTRTLTSLIFLVAIVLNVLPFVLYSGAIFMIDVFGVAELTGFDSRMNLLMMTTSLAVVGGCYAIFGGLKAVAVSDTVNGVGLVIGGLMIPILGLSFVGGGSVMEGVSVITTTYPERLSSLGDSESNIPWSTLLTGMTLITTYYWCTNQGIVQRTFASKNLAEGQKGVLFAAVMKLAGPLYLVLPGIIAWHIAKSGMASGEVKLPADANNAYGFLVASVLPGWARGFFAATIFGAILSSFNSFLNSSTTLFSLDLYKRLIRTQATDKQCVAAGKLFGVAMIVVSIVMAMVYEPLAKSQLFDLMKSLAAVVNVPLLAIIFVGFVSRVTSARAANVALLTGMAFQFAFGVWFNNGQNQIGRFAGPWRAEGSEFAVWLNLHWLHLAAITFLLMLAIMAILTKLAPRPEPFQQTYTEDVDITPWPKAKACGVVIVVLIAAMYIGMWAKFGVTPGRVLANEYDELHAAPASIE